jgi:hypothetical protein
MVRQKPILRSLIGMADSGFGAKLFGVNYFFLRRQLKVSFHAPAKKWKGSLLVWGAASFLVSVHAHKFPFPVFSVF